jgi:hypothetical protein
VEVELIEAGHCPHDEAPAIVNERLQKFVERSVLSRMYRPPGTNGGGGTESFADAVVAAAVADG